MPVILFQKAAPGPAPAPGTESAQLFAATPGHTEAVFVPDPLAPALNLPTSAAAAPLKHRKDVYDLTDAEVAALRLAFEKVYAINDDRGFQYWAGIHGYPLPVWCQHGTPLFAVWHRPYLYLFEKALQDQVKGVTLPYWDWTSARAQKEGLPKIYTDAKYTDASGVTKPNPLSGSAIKFAGTRFEHTVRDPGEPSDLVPLARMVTSAQRLRNYERYSTALENPHNAVHGWVGGTMGQVPYAAYDPIFWAHHVNIDRLFALWQAEHPTVKPIPSIWEAVLAPFSMTTKDIWDTRRLGYNYTPHKAHAAIVAPGELVTHESFNPAATSKFGGPLLEFAMADVLGAPRPVELEFQQVKQPKQSFELRVFFNLPTADASTPTEGNPNYAGSLHFFGHGECGGDAGHCDVPSGPTDPYDLRPPHHRSPMTLRLDVTDTLHALRTTASAAAMTLIAVDPKGKHLPNPGTDFGSVAVIS
jgi:tyrosinase